MKFKKFIKKVHLLIDIKESEKEDKKNMIISYIKKLNKRKIKIKELLKDKKTKESDEELSIIKMHIKKGKKLLSNLCKKENILGMDGLTLNL